MVMTPPKPPSGTPGAIRTRNLEIRSLSLYPLSYGGAITCDSHPVRF